MRSPLAASLVVSFFACTISGTQADLRLICERFTAWQQDPRFLALQPFEKQEAIADFLANEVKTEGVREKLAIQKLPADVNRAYYSLAPKGYRCPAIDRSYPPD